MNFLSNLLPNTIRNIQIQSNITNNNTISLISFNSNGVKRNLAFIQELCQYDVIFLCETWLLNDERLSLLNNLSLNHSFFHCSDMLFSPAKGRPYGGRSFIINKRLEIVNHDFVNQYIATLSIRLNIKTFTIIACYLPYDNGSMLNLSEFQSCIQVISELFNFYQSKFHSVLIVGDFNADLMRNKRFDLFLNNFIENNSIVVVSASRDNSQFSYEKGEYTAMLDHCFASSLDLVNYNCSLVNNEINFSDHKPLKIIMVWLSMYSGKQAYSVDLDSYKNIITIPPNFDNDEIKEKFNSILINNINYFMDQPIDDINNNQNIIDNMYSQLTTSMVSAFKSCCRTVSVNNMKKQKNWFTSELQVLKNKMLILRYKTRKTEIEVKIIEI